MSRHSNYMVRSQIRSIDANASRLRDIVGPETKVDEWAQTYVATADDRLNAVHDYLTYRQMSGLGGLNTTQVGAIGAGGALLGLILIMAAPSLSTRLNTYTLKKAALAAGIGALVFGGGAGGYYLYQQSNDPFRSDN